MSRCPCGSGVPAPLWLFCEDCALQRCRALMSPEPIPPPSVAKPRAWRRNDLVLVAETGVEPRPGRVVRADRKVGGQYVVELEDGSRAYVGPRQMRER